MVFTLYRHVDLLKEHGHFGSYSTLNVFTAHVTPVKFVPSPCVFSTISLINLFALFTIHQFVTVECFKIAFTPCIYL